MTTTNNTTTHTPGPWMLGDCDGLSILGPRTRFKDGRRALACIATCDDSEKPAEDAANARLIAAAPDLLAALKRAEALLAIAYNPGIEDSVTLTATHCQWAANAARAAILKAEGAK